MKTVHKGRKPPERPGAPASSGKLWLLNKHGLIQAAIARQLAIDGRNDTVQPIERTVISEQAAFEAMQAHEQELAIPAQRGAHAP